jgi:ankyrin repeat protein
MNFTNIAIFLIDHHSRVNWQDIGGRTAIYFAVQHNNFTLVKYLLLHMADPGIPTLSK